VVPRVLCVLNVLLSVLLVLFVYFGRVSLFSGGVWGWLLVCVACGCVVFLLWRLVSVYRYKPFVDVGFRPTLSVVVPCFNEEAGIANTVKSVLCSGYPKGKLELVVVDDCSSDGSLMVLQSLQKLFSFEVVALSENVGKRCALAAGVRRCKGEVVVFMDSDAVVAPDAFVNLVAPLADSGVFGVCGNAVVANQYGRSGNTLVSRLQRVWYADCFLLRKGVESLFGMVLCCSGVLSAYRRCQFDLVVDEWVNDRFLGRPVRVGDDRHLTNLMLRLGGRTVFQSNATVFTVVPSTFRRFCLQQKRWARGFVWGTLFTATFFGKKSLVQRLIFGLFTLFTVAAPVAFVFGVGYLVLFGGVAGLLHFVVGLFLVSLVFASTDLLLVDYFTFKDVFYRLVLFVLMIPVLFVYLYGWVTPHKAAVWGTR